MLSSENIRALLTLCYYLELCNTKTSYSGVHFWLTKVQMLCCMEDERYARMWSFSLSLRLLSTQFTFGPLVKQRPSSESRTRSYLKPLPIYICSAITKLIGQHKGFDKCEAKLEENRSYSHFLIFNFNFFLGGPNLPHTEQCWPLNLRPYMMLSWLA